MKQMNAYYDGHPPHPPTMTPHGTLVEAKLDVSS